jgi:hypothetical protein
VTAQPMMACGHRANAVHHLPDGGTEPSCAICAGLTPGALIPVPEPDLTGRTARCSYYGTRPRPLGGAQCQSERPSTAPGLAFFEHQPDKPFDRYFCGCWGWD